MKRILITGASGFIGSRLAIRAAQAGHAVIATARHVSPALEDSLGRRVQRLDVLDAKATLFSAEADAIFHCATANDILSADFAAGVALSVNGTRNVLEMAVKNSIQNVVFFSTLQVYGAELEGTITETTPPRCASPYALNHLLGEEVCRLYAEKYGLNIAIIRPANVYGVPDSPIIERSTLVPMCFVKSALKRGTIALKASGNQRRNFISTDEVADVCLYLLEHFPKGVKIVNAGSNWLASIHEIAQMVKTVHMQHLGKSPMIQILAAAPEHGNHFTIASELNFLRVAAEESRVKMESIILKLYHHFARI